MFEFVGLLILYLRQQHTESECELVVMRLPPACAGIDRLPGAFFQPAGVSGP